MEKQKRKRLTPEKAIRRAARQVGVFGEEVRLETERSSRMAFPGCGREAREKLCAIPSAGDFSRPEERSRTYRKA